MNTRLAIALLAVLFAPFAQADEFSSELDWTVYEGNINGDMYPDIYIKQRPLFVPVAGNPVTPLFIPRGGSVVLLGDSDGGYGNPIITMPASLSGLSKVSSARLSFGDFNEDGRSDISIEGLGSGDLTLVVFGSSKGTVPQETLELGGFPNIAETVPMEFPDVVGRTPVSVDVNALGDLEIAVPVQLPSGINSHQPNISISYSSGRSSALNVYDDGISSLAKAGMVRNWSS